LSALTDFVITQLNTLAEEIEQAVAMKSSRVRELAREEINKASLLGRTPDSGQRKAPGAAPSSSAEPADRTPSEEGTLGAGRVPEGIGKDVESSTDPFGRLDLQSGEPVPAGSGADEDEEDATGPIGPLSGEPALAEGGADEDEDDEPRSPRKGD